MLDIKGVIPALATPSDSEGNLDLAPLPSLINFTLDRGVSGFFVGGSTGEGFGLYADERKQLSEAVMSEVGGKVPVIIHVGSMNYRDVIELSKHAAKIGADAISSVVPFYYLYNLEEVRDYYRAISDASGLPVIVYDLAQVANAVFPPEKFMEAMLSIDGMYGVKFTNPDVIRLNQLKEIGEGRIRFFGGLDQIPLPMLSMGASGLIGSNYNAIPEIWVAVYEAFMKKDLEEVIKLQDGLTWVMRRISRVSPLPRVKKMLQLRGIDAGPPRLPNKPVSPEMEKFLEQTITELFDHPALGTHMKK
jgi:N-acetylneuraminate lyase